MLESHAWTWLIVNPIKLETGLRPYSAGILYTLLSRIEAIGFPTFGLLLQNLKALNPYTLSLKFTVFAEA